MPKPTPHTVALKKHRQNLKEKSQKYTPGTVNLQVLGSGAHGAPRCLYIFTDQSRYIFNCGEGTQRLAHEHKMKLSKLEHIFVTHNSWENIGGLPGLALTIQDVGVPQITLHGPPGTDLVFSGTRRFVVLRHLALKTEACERDAVFEDNVMRVRYIPLYNSAGRTWRDTPVSERSRSASPDKNNTEDSTDDDIDYYAYWNNNNGGAQSRSNSPSRSDSPGRKKKRRHLSPENKMNTRNLPPPGSVSMAYVCKLQDRPGTLDLKACVARGVPPGPLLGRLKAGEDIELPNGTVVLSKDVTSPDEPGPVFVVVECPSEEFLDSLLEEELFHRHQSSTTETTEQASVVVHFTSSDVMQHPRYQEWMSRFAPSTHHLILNDSNSCLGSTAIHRIQHKLRLLSEDLFPALPHQSDSGITNSTEVNGMQDLKKSFPIIQGHTLNTVHLRPQKIIDWSVDYTLAVVDLDLADHLALQFEVSLSQVSIAPICGLRQVQKRIMSKKNMDYFKMLLEMVDWSYLQSCSSANECFESFFNHLLSLLDISFPLETKKSEGNLARKNRPSSSKDLNWYSPELKIMKSFILICKEMYRQENNPRLLATLKTLKSEYRVAIREAKKRKNEEVIEKSSNKCRTAWTIINKAAGRNHHKGVQTNTTPDVFNQFFITSVEEISAKVNSSTDVALQKLQVVDVVKPEIGCVFTAITPEDVFNTVMSLKSSTTKDAYDMSNDFLKNIIYLILLPLTYCLNLCILEGVFPECLEFSRVVPIFKKGNLDDPSSYRPISCIPTMAKVLEKILKSQICQYFESYNLFSPSQFGYRSGRSTVQAIDSLVHDLLLILEMKHSAQVTLCDLSKAFDTVQHDILLGKLSFYGFKGKDLAIFESYLKDRKQLVDINGVHSQVLNIKLGVPQGSVLGPILFLIVINDLSFNLNNYCLSTLFADDTSMLVSHQDFTELRVLADSCLSNANVWFETNGLFLNVDKTQTLLVSLKNNIVLEDNVKLLGITVDSNLSWKTHIENVCKRLSRVIFLLANLKRQVTEKYLKMSYYAFFESIIRYGLIVWGNSVDVVKVLLLQKKAVRILTSSDYLEHCKPLFIKTGILTVFNLYIFDVLRNVKLNVKCLSQRSAFHDHKTRNRNNLDLPRCRLSKTMSYHRYLGIKLYNKLPVAWQDLPLKKFSVILYEWLSKNPFYSIDEYFMSPKLQFDPEFWRQETLDVEGFPEELATLRDQLTSLPEDEGEFPHVVFLGTGSCIPSKTRNTSGILVNFSETSSMILDCGEATYGQLVRLYGSRTSEVLRGLQAIYVSHLHADHHIGLVALLRVAPRPLYLLAPRQIRNWLNTYHNHFQPVMDGVSLVPNDQLLYNNPTLDPGTEQQLLSSLGLAQVRTCTVRHCPNAFGVAITHRDGWKLTYSGDTMPCDELVKLGTDSHLLIHEATMEDDLESEARIKMHSTTSQAIEIGRRMGAKFTLLTHFSQRYAKVPMFSENLTPDVGIAFDNMKVRFCDVAKLPKMYSALKLMFAEHYDEMEQKAAKRLIQLARQQAQLPST